MTELMHIYVLVAIGLMNLGIGFYMGQRGWEGVKVDIANARTEITLLKNKIEAHFAPQATSPQV